MTRLAWWKIGDITIRYGEPFECIGHAMVKRDADDSMINSAIFRTRCIACGVTFDTPRSIVVDWFHAKRKCPACIAEGRPRQAPAPIEYDMPTHDERLRILSEIDAGHPQGERYSSRPQDKHRWAGDAVMRILDCDERRAKAVLADMIAQSELVEKDYRSKAQRKLRKGLFLRLDLFA